jgi:hypothetical protein
MTLQAQSLGFASRQFRAFDKEGLTQEFAVPPHWEIMTMTAFGRPAPDRGRTPSDQYGDGAPRVRRPPEHLRWPHAEADAGG